MFVVNFIGLLKWTSFFRTDDALPYQTYFRNKIFPLTFSEKFTQLGEQQTLQNVLGIDIFAAGLTNGVGTCTHWCS